MTGLAAAAQAAGLFDELGTAWLLLDAELMPWSAKAGELLRDQYAAVGRGRARRAARRGRPRWNRPPPAAWTSRDCWTAPARAPRTRPLFTAAYRRYCWPTDGLAGVRLAPFQLLACEGSGGQSRPHGWHLAWPTGSSRRPRAARAHPPDPVDLADPASVAAATAWWEELTGWRRRGHGGQARREPDPRRRGLVQPGLKVRGREYLRIIYGPDYTEPDEPRTGCAARGLGHKRSLALREYALGLEAARPAGPRRAALARARMRVRRAGARVGTGRPAAVNRTEYRKSLVRAARTCA